MVPTLDAHREASIASRHWAEVMTLALGLRHGSSIVVCGTSGQPPERVFCLLLYRFWSDRRGS